MALELKQQLRLSQQLVMTPQLQQAIKLLQLSRIELVDLVQKELEENPVLEESLDGEEGEEPREAAANGEEIPTEAATTDASATSTTGIPSGCNSLKLARASPRSRPASVKR